MKRSPLKRNSPLKSSGKLLRSPMKRKPKKAVPALERVHHQLVRSLPCLVPGCGNPSTLHHVSSTIFGGRIARSERRVVNLCATHHLIQFGPRESVEALSHKGFYATYGIDLLAVADRLWREYEATLTTDCV